MKVDLKDLVGGKIEKFQKNVVDDDDGFIVTKGNKKYFLGFTDPQEVYVKELVI